MPEQDERHQIEALQHRIAELESELRASEGRLRSVTDSAPVGIFLDNAAGKATYINKKCAELIGVPAEDALEHDWMPYLHPEDRDAMVSAWQTAFTTATTFRMEYRWVHADGRIVWTLGEVEPILDEHGQVELFVGTLTDITARRVAEQEREALQAQLVQAQKMESIGRLAGGIAHDYNNMLGAILGYTELAMRRADSGPVSDLLDEIQRATMRSADITRQLMSFARKQTMAPRVLDLNTALEEMLQMLRSVMGEGIEVVWQPQSGSIPIKIDPSHLDRAVLNLCLNARDALSGTGTVTLQSSSVFFGKHAKADGVPLAPGAYARLSVRDDGCGIDAETLPNIFEPFFTTKAEGRGTGLGLASVYGSIHQNQGFMQVSSELGVGSEFTIHLPLHHEAEPSPKALVPLAAAEGTGETILIVEDERALLNLARRILEGANYKVLAANMPAEAILLAERHPGPIHLVLTDVIMPELNGVELAQRLLQIRPEMTCLFMSGYAGDVLSDLGLEDPLHLLHKPFSIQQLGDKVREVLDAASRAPTPDV